MFFLRLESGYMQKNYLFDLNITQLLKTASVAIRVKGRFFRSVRQAFPRWFSFLINVMCGKSVVDVCS
jgi:hypothetical protein